MLDWYTVRVRSMRSRASHKHLLPRRSFLLRVLKEKRLLGAWLYVSEVELSPMLLNSRQTSRQRNRSSVDQQWCTPRSLMEHL
jgi:hypothetical protein